MVPFLPYSLQLSLRRAYIISQNKSEAASRDVLLRGTGSADPKGRARLVEQPSSDDLGWLMIRAMRSVYSEPISFFVFVSLRGCCLHHAQFRETVNPAGSQSVYCIGPSHAEFDESRDPKDGSGAKRPEYV